ncbi:Origin recognition complex, subunit 1 [Dispira parvispora]|uniref:Origin recognition complex, subunit 1 n=1 Tax=Dispira parvispora TaxID=1520584 RepID=A0A9W8AKE0_9FUNG|nr:Origin recognition complex, subunit 1 [Dispira parvispora]
MCTHMICPTHSASAHLIWLLSGGGAGVRHTYRSVFTRFPNCMVTFVFNATRDMMDAQVSHHHTQLCRLHNLEVPTNSVLSSICSSLGASRCILVESSRFDIHQRVRLNVSESDLVTALKPDPFFRVMVG